MEQSAPTSSDADAGPVPGRRRFVMLDGFNLSLEKGTGVATYARNLAENLKEMGCETGLLYGGPSSARHSPLLQEVTFYDAQAPSEHPLRRLLRRGRSLLALPTNKAFEVPITGAVIAEQFRARIPRHDSIWNAPDLFEKAAAQFDLFGVTNRVTALRPPDLMHWTYPLPLWMPGVPNIYTLHDLVPLRLPYTTLDRKARYLKLLRWICARAAHIVTVSENSRRDIINMLGVSPDRVTNTYQAVSIPEHYRNRTEEDVRTELYNVLGLDFKEYFLFFGSIEPKKNIGRLLEAYLASGVQTPLVIVGAQAWKSEQELRMLEAEQLRDRLLGGEAGQRNRIVQLEYAPFPLLVSLIRGAKAVLFPSLYEGFGLPILEAMSLGTPVLSSNVSSVPEIAGDAALLVSPYEVAAIAAAIGALDRDDVLRSRLGRLGIEQAARFSASAYHGRLEQVYGKYLSTGGDTGRRG